MKPRAPVLGVLGLCWVRFGSPTHVEPPYFKGPSTPVLGVLGSRARARVCGKFLKPIRRQKKSYARTKKPNKPNTLNTPSLNALNLLVFICVGFVSGWVILCWVENFGGVWR